MRKLQDNFQCFQDKLVDREVYSSFTSITNKAKKFAKPETKVGIIYTCKCLYCLATVVATSANF